MYLTTITMFFFFYFILQLRHSGKVFFIQKPDRTPFFPGQKQMTAHPMPESQRGDLSQRPHLELWIPDYPHAEKYSVKLAEYFPYVFSSTHPPCSCLLQRHEAERALTGSWRNKNPADWNRRGDVGVRDPRVSGRQTAATRGYETIFTQDQRDTTAWRSGLSKVQTKGEEIKKNNKINKNNWKK